jgi:predicted permease
VFDGVAAYRLVGANLSGAGEPEHLMSWQVSADFFRLLGAPVAVGRTFTTDEERFHGPHVAVLSYGLWQRRFGADPHVIGRTLTLNDVPHVIVGALGSGFDAISLPYSSGLQPEVWTPLQFDPTGADRLRYLLAIGRLRPDMSFRGAQARLQRAAEQFRQQFPDHVEAGSNFVLEPLLNVIVRDSRLSLLLLEAAVGLVLLIACGNLAHLLLVRASVRQGELAIRAALGASGRRILWQMLVESLSLSVVGGLLGGVIGIVGIRTLLGVSPAVLPRIGVHGSALTLNWEVLAFTMLLSIVTGVGFGIVPALAASRSGLFLRIHEHPHRAGASPGQSRLRGALVITEVALTLVLLIASTLLIRTLVALRSVNPGFDSHHVLTLTMNLNDGGSQSSRHLNTLVRIGIDRLHAIAGVESAALGCCVPMLGTYNLPFSIVNRPFTDATSPLVRWVDVSPGFFDVFKIPLIRGRLFTGRDDTDAPGVVIINQAMARQFWSDGDPLTNSIRIGKGFPGTDDTLHQIVGVVGNVRDGGLDREATPLMYVPLAQVPDALAADHARVPMQWMVRTRAEPRALRELLQTSLQDLAGGVPVATAQSMDELVRDSTAQTDFMTILMSLFGGVALLLAVIGIYGVMAFVVQQRRHEIGVRLALGATSRDIQHIVFSRGLTLVVIGVLVGLAGAFAVTHFLSAFLFGVTARDPLVFLTAPVLLTIVAVIAMWIPVREAMHVDPVVALRLE